MEGFEALMPGIVGAKELWNVLLPGIEPLPHWLPRPWRPPIGCAPPSSRSPRHCTQGKAGKALQAAESFFASLPLPDHPVVHSGLGVARRGLEQGWRAGEVSRLGCHRAGVTAG